MKMSNNQLSGLLYLGAAAFYLNTVFKKFNGINIEFGIQILILGVLLGAAGYKIFKK